MKEDLKSIVGVGPGREKQLRKLGITCVSDLLEYFPRTYEDRSKVSNIQSLVSGTSTSVCGVVQRIVEKKLKPRMSLLEILISDETGGLYLVFFNQSYKKNFFKIGQTLHVYGKVEIAYGRKQMNSPYTESVIEGKPLELGIIPIYPLVEGVYQSFIRQSVRNWFAHNDTLDDIIPLEIRSNNHFMNRYEAIKEVHFPTSNEHYLLAKKTLVFEELYVMQMGLLLLKEEQTKNGQTFTFLPNGTMTKKFIQSIPFTLTKDQEKAFAHICCDMENNSTPMQRLIQGDVGSGKTIVATMALVKTVENGMQGAIMAPTEILAQQHYDDLRQQLEGISINVALLIGSTKEKERSRVCQGLRDGTVQIVVGTHALIQEGVVFSNLGLVVIDEQHRFGVRQRAALQEKGLHPHVLVLTATPIPRTMALTVYGDLDVSTIKEMPRGRKKIKTYGVDSTFKKRVYSFFRKEMENGGQVYVVCPLVEESEVLDLQAATDLYEEIREHFKGAFRVGLLHGRMSSVEKDDVMRKFQHGAIQLLVSTTVIEVGVNVPNATVMCIMGAERFGLSQLHQLRGRVGRGHEQGYCILMSDSQKDEAKERIALMTSTTDGFVLAEKDLIMRGAGQLFGHMQHGLPDLKMANIIKDVDTLIEARGAAQMRLEEKGRAYILNEAEDVLRKRFKNGLYQLLYS